jgi:hypothetical protein
LIAALILGTFAHVDNIRHNFDSIDKLELIYGDMKPIVREGANISFVFLGDTTNYLYSYLWNKYVLAPRCLSPVENEYDTELIICPSEFLDSTVHSMIFKRQILWKKQVSNFCFFLSCDKPNAAK